MEPNMGYDRASTVFSPDGRLFQVEYAREAVQRGAPAVGIKYADGVLILADKKITSKLIEVNKTEKIFKVADNIGCTTSGLFADGRILIDRIRVEAQKHLLTYDEPIKIEELVKSICDFEQNYTQYGGVRPFGTSLLVGGVDEEGYHLFETDPSGAMLIWKATAIGSGRELVMPVLEQSYREDMTKEEAIVLGLKCLNIATEGKISDSTTEIAVVDKSKKFYKSSEEEVREFIEQLPKEEKK
ncbi:MAG: archaeal proteasome endopeptidase complex subunit alpha [Candidatus Thermoplasmatota archaeon]|nr:archaeal proteasome endopeptidase complex subunit alpha [Candidatus Thermoplasmatota archaeon]